MCLICEKLTSNQMTLNEARKNIMELRVLDDIESDHYHEIIQAIAGLQKKEDDNTTTSSLGKIESSKE